MSITGEPTGRYLITGGLWTEAVHRCGIHCMLWYPQHTCAINIYQYSSITIKHGKNIFNEGKGVGNTTVNIPKFCAGDIVVIMDYSMGIKKVGIVEESVSVGEGSDTKFEYHVADYDAPYSGYDTYQEYSLTFRKHDEKWEKYYTEMMESYRQHEMSKLFVEQAEQKTEHIVKVFKKGDRVNVSSPLIEGVGVITEANGDDEYAEYVVRVDGERNERIFYEKNLELISPDPNRDSVITESRHMEESMKKFKVGDHVEVKINKNETRVGTITEVVAMPPHTSEKYQEYGVVMEGNYRGVYSQCDLREYHHPDEHVESAESKFFEQFLPTADAIKPKFKVGDVVNVIDHPYTDYVVNGSLLVEGETTVHLYDVSPICNVDDGAITCDESLMIFRYHDKQWAEYFTEGTTIGNGLAKWRGKLYNFCMFYGNLSEHKKLNVDLMTRYHNHTIPPEFMEHILKSHSVWDRMTEVLRISENREKLMEKFNLNSISLDNKEYDVRKKININNINDMEYGNRGRLPHDVADGTLSRDELSFVNEVMKLDDGKDHYPAYMTYSQIMEAIAEAYENGSKTGEKIRMQPSLDRRTGKSKPPVRGQRIYRGTSKTHKLRIEFWYDLDLNVIDTAYPLNTHDDD